MTSGNKVLFTLIFFALGAIANHFSSDESIFDKSTEDRSRPIVTASTEEPSKALSPERLLQLEQTEKLCTSEAFSKSVEQTDSSGLLGFWKVELYDCPEGEMTEALKNWNEEMKKGTASSYWKIDESQIITKNSFRAKGACMNCGQAKAQINSNGTMEMTYLDRSLRCANELEEDGADILNKPMNLKFERQENKIVILFPAEGHSAYFTNWCTKGDFAVHLAAP